MSSSRPWVKVWDSWWTSRSHANLDRDTLGIGLRILSLTGAAPEQEGDTRYCLDPAGEPMSRRAMARECRCGVRLLTAAIGRLVGAGTLVEREDGAVGFPKWDEYQLSPSALRMRRKRHADRHSDARCDGESARTLAARGQRSEVRGEQETPRELPPPPPEQHARAREHDAVAWKFEYEAGKWPRLVEELGVRLTCPTRGAVKLEGIQRALDDFGPEIVERVIAFQAQRTVQFLRSNGREGDTEAYLGRMFVGDGFGARLAAWRERSGSSSPAPAESMEAKLARLKAERGLQ